MLVLIDADPIVYRCGFASERTSWHLIYETATGEVDEIEFTPDEEHTAGDYMADWLAFNEGKVTVLDKSRIAKPDPVSYALRATNVQIESIIAECEDRFKQPSKMLMWISGKGGSFRDRIATVRPYKGNRDPSHKPVHYDSIREHLRVKYNSYMTSGIEADDAVSIYARKHYETGGGPLVICTIDKDLDQIPGNHYNYMSKVFYAITETEAERWFAYQCLAGDTTDNILGVWKCGDKQTNSILSRFSPADFGRTVATGGGTHGRRTAESRSENTSPLQSAVCEHGAANGPAGNAADAVRAESGATGAIEQSGEHSPVEQSSAAAGATTQSGLVYDIPSDRSMGRVSRRSPYKWWPAVIAAYRDSQAKPNCPYAKNNPEAIAIEMAQLVKLQEYPGQLWHPHGDLVVPGFGEENFDG